MPAAGGRCKARTNVGCAQPAGDRRRQRVRLQVRLALDQLLRLTQPGGVGVRAADAASADGQVRGAEALPHVNGLAPFVRGAAASVEAALDAEGGAVAARFLEPLADLVHRAVPISA